MVQAYTIPMTIGKRSDKTFEVNSDATPVDLSGFFLLSPSMLQYFLNTIILLAVLV